LLIGIGDVEGQQRLSGGETDTAGGAGDGDRPAGDVGAEL
jgi:hypothetical protein